MRTTLFTLVALFLSGGSSVLATSHPVADTAIAPATPYNDVDLIVVRERAYDAGGVDLSAYGIGSGPVDFVQSFYFRLFTQGLHNQESVIAGTVTFPPGTRILGFLTAQADLGDPAPGDGYSASDALFAIAQDPADYEVGPRGFETGGGPAANEYLCQISDSSFAFALDVTTGVDDFRVILDYGVSFPQDMSFRVDLTDEPIFGVTASTGVILGDPASGGGLGSGDYGEVARLAYIPLTASGIPAPGSAPAPDAMSIFLARETGIDPRIDLLATKAGAFLPGEFAVPVPYLYSPRSVVPGENGLLYVIGDETDLVSIDPVSGAITPIPIPDLPGVNIRMASRAGDPRLFILRETSWPDPEAAWIDVWNPATSTFTGNFATFPVGYLANPVDLLSSSDGTLYALGRTTGFHQVEVERGSIRPHVWPLPDLPGDYRRGAADPGSAAVYLLRDSTSGPTLIDRLDTATGLLTPEVATLPAAGLLDAGPMLVDNDGVLWIFGKNGGAAALLLDDLAAPPMWQTGCLDLPGTTNHAGIARSPRQISPPGSSRPLHVARTSDPALLRLTWESLDDPGLVYNLYQGTIGEFGLHAPLACHMPDNASGSGVMSMEIQAPAGDSYWIVSASDVEREGSAGPLPAAGSVPACGPRL